MLTTRPARRDNFVLPEKTALGMLNRPTLKKCCILVDHKNGFI